MYIRSIKAAGKKQQSICFEHGDEVRLYTSEVAAYGLREGMEVSQRQYEQLLAEIWIPRAKRRAMHLLERMDRSEAWLQQKLKESGYPKEAVREAMAYVASYHYVDDERMARSHIRFYQDSRSRMRLQQDLRKKGISDDMISLCMEEEYQKDECDLIRALLQKKHYSAKEATYEEQGKMYRFLLQRGFASADISRVLRDGFVP